jgi:hypothetical protein
MNVTNDRWESYTDKTGRRHWRWPAAPAVAERDGRDVDADSRQRAGLPLPQQARLALQPLRGK